MKKALLIFPLLLICFSLPAQKTEETETGEEAPAYEPYAEDEFPSWLLELRRAEVVFIGSFPISMLFTSLSYEGIRAVRNAVTGAETTGARGLGNAEFSPEESRWVLLVGTVLSAAVAVTDYIIGRVGGGDGE